MSVDLETASRYRQYADELREAASQASPDTQKALLIIAAEYEQMALLLEASAEANRALAERLEEH